VETSRRVPPGSGKEGLIQNKIPFPKPEPSEQGGGYTLRKGQDYAKSNLCGHAMVPLDGLDTKTVAVGFSYANRSS